MLDEDGYGKQEKAYNAAATAIYGQDYIGKVLVEQFLHYIARENEYFGGSESELEEAEGDGEEDEAGETADEEVDDAKGMH